MSSSFDSSQHGDRRPDFMTVLGLLPPYSVDDVKQAYLSKIKTAHPDYGGDISEFRRVQEAYEQAQHYVAIQDDRRAWIASQMDRYLAQQAIEERLRAFGVELDVPHTTWLKDSLGDFAELTAAIEGIALTNRPVGNAVIDYMVQHRESLSRLKRLVLPGCGITIDHALRLSCFSLLSYVDLSRNRLGSQIVTLVESLPLLETFRVDDASVGWLSRRKLERILKKRQAEAGIGTMLTHLFQPPA